MSRLDVLVQETNNNRGRCQFFNNSNTKKDAHTKQFIEVVNVFCHKYKSCIPCKEHWFKEVFDE